MNTRIGRRRAIALMGAASAAALAACGSSPTEPAATTGGTTAGGSTNSTCAVTPSETVGPYPSVTDLFRSDIREDRPGTPLALTITVVNTNNGCAPVSGANVEIWQCDATGNYSQYGSQAARTYLRGIQTTDANGQVNFTTVYPGWLSGTRGPRHFKIRTTAPGGLSPRRRSGSGRRLSAAGSARSRS